MSLTPDDHELIPAAEYFQIPPWERSLEQQRAAERADGLPDGAIDAVLTRWQGLLPRGYTATDVLKAADSAIITQTRNIARLAVMETL